MKDPSWKLYERLVARLIADQLSTAYCVTPNARVRGRISGRKRQLDVLIDLRHDTDNSRRIIVDAKRRRRKVDVRDVESLRGLMDDVGATHGYLVCPVGFTRAAQRRAQQAVSIRLMPLDRLEGFDPSTWPPCSSPHCPAGSVFWDGYPSLSLKLRHLHTGADELIDFIYCVGKCDRCGRFHVLCMTCNQLLAPLEDDDSDTGHRCKCNVPWFWLASVENDCSGPASAELHLAMLSGKIITVSRRGLSS